MNNVNEFKAAVAAGIAVLTALWGWFGWLVVLFVGGNWNEGTYAGLLSFNASTSSSGSYSNVSARLLCEA